MRAKETVLVVQVIGFIVTYYINTLIPMIMELKWFTRSLLFLLISFFYLPIMAQDVELTSQAEVNAFAGTTKVNGYLLIRGNDITDLSPLSSLDTIGHSLFIEYNRKLKLLNGLTNVVYVGGSLFIDSNTELDSIAAFGKVKMIKGPLVLRDNFLLRECCALYPLVSGQQGIIKGGTIIEGNKGCKTRKELLQDCDADTDNDGVDDTEDGCPTDSLKINPGICGCGHSELDTDRDGTPDCKDACPNDPNKTEAGDCGCGKEDTDSDNDGVADCNDDCPYNPSISKSGICGCENPRILDIKVSDIGSCNDKGTPSPSDDTYTATITLTFEGAPTSGTVLITGDANEAILFTEENTSKSYTLFNVPFRADGELIEVIATFKNNEKCKKRRVFGIFAPKHCSSSACNAPNNITADTENYPDAALLTWSDLGETTTYEVDYRVKGSTIWIKEAAITNQLLLINLLDYTQYEYQIRSFCDGEKYSEYTKGTFTSGGKECKIIRATVKNINCQDNDTPDDATDDYFSFDLFVEGSNVGNDFSVSNIAGDNIGLYNQQNTFRTATGTLGKGDVQIIITDNTDTNCQIEATVEDPEVCSNDCQINFMTIDEVHRCWDRGSRWNTADDFFTADLTVHFTNTPSAGTLELTGKTKGSISVEALQNVNSYTFSKVRIPATGKDFVLGAKFTNGVACEYTADFKGVLIKDKICSDQCNIMNVQVMNTQCNDNGTSDDESDDYLTFEVVITGVNLAGQYQINNVAGNNQGSYNEIAYFRTNSGQTKTTIELELRDANDDACNYTIALENKCLDGARNNPYINQTRGTSATLQLYPNPAQDELILEYTKIIETSKIIIYDMLGQNVLTQSLSGNKLDISQLEKGIYHLVLHQGATFETKKFVKK